MMQNNIRKQQLENELKEIQKMIKSYNDALNPLKVKIKQINGELEEIEVNSKIENGFSRELLEFYDRKVPSNNKNDYMSWCISKPALELFEKYADTDYWNRYQTYSFTDELWQAFTDKNWKDDDLDVRKEIIESFLEFDLQSFDGLTEDETKVIRDYMFIVNGITSNSFMFDW